MLLQFKKDYLRLVEVYVLEVLPRQDDWDIASDFVMGDFVMGAKRKEVSLLIQNCCDVPLIPWYRYSKCSNAYTKPRQSTPHQQRERDDHPPTYLEAAARRL